MKKARKSKFVIGGVALLSCVALAGVGYSSWVITSTVSSQTGNVSVTASAVEDDRITIGNITTISGSYKFGPSAEDSGGYISASGTSEESLSVEFSFDVSWSSTLNKTYNITLALASSVKCSTDGTVGGTDMDALAYATSTSVTGTEVEGTYLAAPAEDLVGDTGITIATVTSSGVTSDYSSTELTSGSAGLKVEVSNSNTSPATVTVTAAFGWGSYFGSENPVLLSDPDYLDDYVAGLNWLYSAFGSANFIYTIGGAIQTTQTENTETTSN